MNFIAEERKKRRETTFHKPRSFPSWYAWNKNWSFVLLRTKLGFCALGTKLGFCASEKDSKPLRQTDRQTETWWKNCKFCHHLPYPAVWSCNKKSHEISISLVPRSDMKNHKPFKIFPFLPRLLAASSDYLSILEKKQKNRHTSPKHSCLYSSSVSFQRFRMQWPTGTSNSSTRWRPLLCSILEKI